MDAKYSRWLSADPAVGEYIPVAPTDDEAKKHNQSLLGMGGVFNVVNFQLYHYAGNNPVKYIDLDGDAFTFKVAENEYWFLSDLCIADKAFDDLVGLIPYSSLSKKLADTASDLNRIDEISTKDIIKSVGNDFALSIIDKSDKGYLKSFGKTLNKINITKTLYLTIKDLLNNQTVGREQFIEKEFFDVLKGTSRKNVAILYAYAKKRVDDFIDCGYISLNIDKKGILKNYTINNQTAVDMLYSDLRNLQLKLNYGTSNE